MSDYEKQRIESLEHDLAQLRRTQEHTETRMTWYRSRLVALTRQRLGPNITPGFVRYFAEISIEMGTPPDQQKQLTYDRITRKLEELEQIWRSMIEDEASPTSDFVGLAKPILDELTRLRREIKA